PTRAAPRPAPTGQTRPGPSVYRPAPGGPGARPLGGPAGRPGTTGRPVSPVGSGGRAGAIAARGAAAIPVSERGPTKRKKDDKDEAKKPAKKGGAKPKKTVADEGDLGEFGGPNQRD